MTLACVSNRHYFINVIIIDGHTGNFNIANRFADYLSYIYDNNSPQAHSFLTSDVSNSYETNNSLWTLNSKMYFQPFQVDIHDDDIHLLCSGIGYTVGYITSLLNISTYPTPTLVSSINGWITIQQRIDGSTSFNRPWVDYRNGFGSCSSNCWFGLEKIYQMMQLANYKLRFELKFYNGTWRSAEYTGFKLDNETAQYTIHVSGFIGDTWDIQDIMNSTHTKWVHNGRPFSTTNGCGSTSGWWWNQCYKILANDPYPPWVIDFKGTNFKLTILRMMMKQVWSFDIRSRRSRRWRCQQFTHKLIDYNLWKVVLC